MAVNGKESKWFKLTSRIPQGSVLGPLLFVLYRNDLPELTKSDTFLFADNIKIFSYYITQLLLLQIKRTRASYNTT